MVVKVAFIGAGSVEFTRNVVTDLCGYPELAGELHLALHDVSAERLGHAQALATRIVAQTGSGATVTASAAMASSSTIPNDSPPREGTHTTSAAAILRIFSSSESTPSQRRSSSSGYLCRR